MRYGELLMLAWQLYQMLAVLHVLQRAPCCHASHVTHTAQESESGKEAAVLQEVPPCAMHQRRAVMPDRAAVQVVVDAVDPGCLVSDCNSKLFDFGSASSADLENITIPLRLQAGALRARSSQQQRMIWLPAS